METTAAADALAEIERDSPGWWKTEARYALNDRLNASEERLRERIGAKAVDRLICEFRAEADRKPNLWLLLYRQASPYAWIYRRAQRRAQRKTP
jgi:hypothetical protein